MNYSLILRRTLLAASAAALCMPAMAELVDIKAAGKLRVGIDFGRTVLRFCGRQDEACGLRRGSRRADGQRLGPATGDREHHQLRTHPQPAVQQGRPDHSSLSITPERQKAVDFSIPYGAIQAAVGAPKSLKLTSIEDLAGKTVAVTRGGPQDKIVTERAPQAKVVRFDDEAASITAAATGQADIVAITPPIIAAIAKKNPAREFETKFILQSYQLGVAMRKDQPELMKAVNVDQDQPGQRQAQHHPPEIRRCAHPQRNHRRREVIPPARHHLCPLT